MRASRLIVTLVCLTIALSAPSAIAQERSYFVTYDHYLEEPGHLEIAIANTTGIPKGPDAVYSAPWLELEYGVTGWWTSELYVEAVTIPRDGSAVTGWRWENRFRPLAAEHRVNPVLYLEYENVNEASRIQKEIVGSGALAFEPIEILRRDQAHELEGRLILSSVVGSWNVSENLIFEKNLTSDEGLEFGYSIGLSRSLASLARGSSCHVCLENFTAGVEAYGGMGSTAEAAWANTRHYVAPVLGWHVTDRSTVKVSVGIGLTDASDRYLLRVGFGYEVPVRRGRR